MTAALPLIEVENLSKSYGPVRALDRVSFRVSEGQVLGFLGPNGAGKSTALRILAGFLPGDSGVVRVAGHDVRRTPLAVRSVIGYLPEGVPLYSEMRVSEYLRFRARIKRIPRRERRARIDQALGAAGVLDVRRRIIDTLSRGYRQRVGLADALLGEPRVLILDEPTVGLDPEQVRQFRALLREVGRDRTVILSTHILREVELVCSDVVIIARGRIAATDRADRLRTVIGGDLSVIAEVAGPTEEVQAVLQAIPGVSRLTGEPAAADDRMSLEGGDGGDTGEDRAGPVADPSAPAYRRYRVYGSAERDLRELVYEAVRERGWPLRHLERAVLSLEDVFLDVVRKEP